MAGASRLSVHDLILRHHASLKGSAWQAERPPRRLEREGPRDRATVAASDFRSPECAEPRQRRTST